MPPVHATLGVDGKVPAAQLPAGGPGGATWGGISGTLSDQTDLNSALSGKEASGAAAAAVSAHEAAGDPHPGYLTAAEAAAAFDAIGAAAVAQAAAIAASQPVDADLTAIAALTTTTYGRAFLALADAAAAKGVLALAKADVGLGSVDNTADSAKAVASAAVLTTPRTINGVSFDGSANIDAVPTWRCGQTTKNLADASTTQNIAHGLGRVPKFVRILGRLAFSAGISMECNAVMCDASQSGSAVIWSEGTSTAVADTIYQSTAAALGFSNAAAVSPFTGATKQSGVVSADATNIIIAWTKTGSPTGTANLAWECT